MTRAIYDRCSRDHFNRSRAMAVRLIARTIGAIALAAIAVPTLATAADFSVLSYNVRGLPSPPIEDRTAQMEQIAPKLEDFHTPGAPYVGQPSLVGLQELFDKGYFGTLTDPLTVTYPGITEKDDGGPSGIGDGLTILSDLKMGDVTRTQWDDCFGTLGSAGSDCDTNKGFTFSRVVFEDETSIDVYTLHADAGQDEKSRVARQSNLRQLADFINLESPSGNAVIVLGDFNSHYTRFDNDIMQELLKSCDLSDVWVQLRRGGIVPPAGPDIDSDCLTDPSTGNCELVDKILYRNGEKLFLLPQSYDVLKAMFSDKSDIDLSDHYPVTASFKALPAADTTTTTTTASTSTSTSTSTLLVPLVCGDATGDDKITAPDALAVLKAAVGGPQCDGVKKLCVCDVNTTGTVTASDAQAVLKAAVGQAVMLNCVC